MPSELASSAAPATAASTSPIKSPALAAIPDRTP